MPYLCEQIGPTDCVIAAMAMYSELDYYEVRAKFVSGIRPVTSLMGTHDHETIKLAKLLDISLKRRFGLPKERAILVVKFPYSLHAVYYDGLNAFDPQWQTLTTAEYLKNTIYYFSKRRFYEKR